MKPLAILLLSTLTIASAFARIGETMSECAKRYGEAKRTEGLKIALFMSTGLVITTYFNESGKADTISFSKPGAFMNDPLSDAQIDVLIKANCAASKMKKTEQIGKFIWTSDDGKYIASYDIIKHVLFIWTKAGMERVYKEKADAERDALKGF